MKVKESIEQFTQRVLEESVVDIDIEYCKKHGIKYKNHENDSNNCDLFTTKSNIAAFEVVFKNR
jgi:hypothetical protein